MFRIVTRRFLKSLIPVLVAVQILFSAPLVTAAPAASEAALEMPCHGMDMNAGSGDSDHCPCCPDGVSTTAGCLSACGATAAGLPRLTLALAKTDAVELPQPVLIPLTVAADPPLKPPPIR
jgi:hypothetical protein